MAKKLGRELLIKRNEQQDGSGNYVTVCGFRSRNFPISTNLSESTTPDCTTPSDPPQYDASPGTQNRTFSGSGIFDDGAAMQAVIADAEAGRKWAYQVIVPGVGSWSGQRIVSEFQFSGEVEGDMAFSATFTQAGAQTFAAE